MERALTNGQVTRPTEVEKASRAALPFLLAIPAARTHGRPTLGCMSQFISLSTRTPPLFRE